MWARRAGFRPTLGWAAWVTVALSVSCLVGCGGSNTVALPSNAVTGVPDYGGHPTIDSIPCETMERAVYHVHAHLAVFADGQSRVIPEGIGIASPRQIQGTPDGPFVAAGSCFYWLHTHTADGIIHIEAPVAMNFRLGQFFDIWQQPLGDTQTGPIKGNVIAYVNSERYSGDIREIPLAAHNLIQLDIGQDVPPQPFAFPAGL